MPAKNIMLQGTASTVGKSVLAAAFCRIFKQDGYRVAPFKSQNMALNSYITLEGKEMGRAQVVQAEAAGVEPTVDMNPILIKPATDCAAQVIVKGKVYKNMTAMSYDESKLELLNTVLASYDTLAAGYELIVIEGAGSPAEINLRDRDIVNMGLATRVDAPVILIGDIDKGGVFASLYGTVMLLDESERQRIKGIIINKFRGDLEILKPGLKMIEDMVNIPVLGVVPFFHLSIDEEDGVTERFNRSPLNVPKTSKGNNMIDIGVISLPHMSNFTDFAPLENQAGVNLTYFNKSIASYRPDLVIIPGSKNTTGDLMFIREAGLEEWLNSYYLSGGLIMGICGGYQMLGRKIADPDMVETQWQEIDGLGFLNMVTRFFPDKVTTRVSAEVADLEGTVLSDLSGARAEGYEIHMGLSELTGDARPFIKISSEFGRRVDKMDGYASPDGRVFGTYIHGIFDDPSFLRKMCDTLLQLKGTGPNHAQIMDYRRFKETQYDQLGALVRESVDMEKVYSIIFG